MNDIIILEQGLMDGWETARATFEEFLKRKIWIGQKASSLKTYQATTGAWVKWCREQGIYPTELTAENIILFITDPSRNRGKGLARASQVREKSIFQQILAGMESEGAKVDNHLWSIHRFRPVHGMGERRKHRSLDSDEIKAILNLWSGDSPYHIRNHAILSLMFASAIRSDEAISAEWKDVNLKKRTIFIPDGKGGVSRYAPILSQTALDSLKRLQASLGDKRRYCFPPTNNGYWGEDKPMTYDTLEDLTRRVYMELGILFRLHDTRHTGLSDIYVATGKDINLVQSVAGHASITTTTIYLPEADAEDIASKIQLDW